MKKAAWFWSLLVVVFAAAFSLGNPSAEAIYSKNRGGDPKYILCDAVNVVSVQDADMGNTAIHDVRTMRFFYNYDMQRMYIDRHPNDGDWRYLNPKGSWAEIGIAHPAGKIAFRLAYGMDFYGR